MSTVPTIAILDWAAAHLSEPTASVEREIVGSAAQVRTFYCNDDSDFTPEICAADAIIVWHNCPISARGIARLEKCKALIRNGVGFDSVDIAAAAARGIPVCNVPDYGTEEVADHAIALTLALCRQLFPLDAEARKLGWTIPTPQKMRRLSALNFGVIGLGRIGTAAALRAKALGFKVSFYDPYLPNGVHKAIGIVRHRTLESLLRESDVVSVHCPLTKETQHLIGDREIAWLKPSAFLVNTARGAVVKKSAIFAALRNERIAGAALDVIEDEPFKNAEEAATPNLIATCHAAFYSIESKLEMRASSARIARAAVLGEPLENVVNGQ